MIRLRTLRDDDRGAAIIELAMVAPVLALMTIGVVDLSNGFGKKMKLEQAAQRAIEKVMNTTGDTTVESTIIAEAAAQAEITTDKVKVNYRLECNGNVSSATECAEGEKQAGEFHVKIQEDAETSGVSSATSRAVAGDSRSHSGNAAIAASAAA